MRVFFVSFCTISTMPTVDVDFFKEIFIFKAYLLDMLLAYKRVLHAILRLSTLLLLAFGPTKTTPRHLTRQQHVQICCIYHQIIAKTS